MNTNINKNFVEEECCSCGVIFLITDNLQRNLKSTRQTFYCPNGHRQSYSKSTAELLEEKIDIKDSEIMRLKNEISKLEKLSNKKSRKKKNKLPS